MYIEFIERSKQAGKNKWSEKPELDSLIDHQ